jgi:biopolymer transport protein ExbD
MPVKLSKHSPENTEARIEIIPLIDIMFFLLAAFMLVSLSMVNLKSVKVNLPTATTATADTKKDFVSLSVDKSGVIYWDKKPIGAHELTLFLQAWQKTNATARVFISGDAEARHGDVIRVLDLVRATGIDKVAFEIRNAPPAEAAAKPTATKEHPAMKRWQWFNRLGVLALAALCVVQWRRDRALNLEVNQLMKTRFEQDARLKDQEKKLTGLTADLDDFRSRFTEANSEAKEHRQKLTATDRQVRQLESDREQLRASVTNWAGAVAQRDERIKEANDRIRDLGVQLNDSVQKFNALATNYNTSVTKYNELATNYNKVVGQLNEARAALAKPAETKQ